MGVGVKGYGDERMRVRMGIRVGVETCGFKGLSM